MVYVTENIDYYIDDSINNHIYFDLTGEEINGCVIVGENITTTNLMIDSPYTYTPHLYRNKLYVLLISLGYKSFIEHMYIGLHMSKELALNIPEILVRVIKYCNDKLIEDINLLKYCTIALYLLNKLITQMLRHNIESVFFIPKNIEHFTAIRKTSPPNTNF